MPRAILDHFARGLSESVTVAWEHYFVKSLKQVISFRCIILVYFTCLINRIMIGYMF